ncbi:MAG: hypothetical protein CMK89_00770 [Pseudomonadales bacterium]|nr:hypothetical protein [Pseudomonadales bacterium]
MIQRIILIVVLTVTGFANANANVKTKSDSVDDQLAELESKLLSIAQKHYFLSSQSRTNFRKRYLELASRPEFQLDAGSLVFPETFFWEEDYAQALHTAFLIWSLSTSGKTVDLPLDRWMNLILDKSKVLPEIKNYLRWSGDIALLLLESRLLQAQQQEQNILAELPWYFDYLHRMRSYSPPLFDAVWLDVRRHSTVLNNSPAMGALYIHLGKLSLPYPLHPLEIPRRSFNASINHAVSQLEHSTAIEQDYRDWVTTGVLQSDLDNFSIPFPQQLASWEEMVAAWHWGYLVRAAVENDLAIADPLLSWINQILSQLAMADASSLENSKRELTGYLIGTWLIKEKANPDALEQLLSNWTARGLLPISLGKFRDSEQATMRYQAFWHSILLLIRRRELTHAAYGLLMNSESIAGDNLVQLATLLSALNDCVSYGNWDLNRVWPEAAHDKLVMLSGDELPGSFKNRGVSIREYAWIIRIKGYGDQLPREEALTLGLWRTDALIDIYNERYKMVWLAAVIGAVCYVFGRKRHPVPALFVTFGVVILIPGGIYLCATVASIGHNTANTSNYLSVLEFCFPFYASLAILYFVAAIRSLYLRFAKANRPDQKAI